MKNLEKIKRNAKYYNLKADYVNDYTLKVFSPKFMFDSWLITTNEDDIELWHQSKKNNIKKCSYHLQTVVPKHCWRKILQKVDKHNNYVAFHKTNNKINLVDRVLNNKK